MGTYCILNTQLTPGLGKLLLPRDFAAAVFGNLPCGVFLGCMLDGQPVGVPRPAAVNISSAGCPFLSLQPAGLSSFTCCTAVKITADMSYNSSKTLTLHLMSPAAVATAAEQQQQAEAAALQALAAVTVR